MFDFLPQPGDLPRPAEGLPRLDRSFYQRDTVAVARGLLGQRLVRQRSDGTRLAGLIVETEAYLGPEDQAAHTKNGHRSARNESMYQQGGTGYVYFTYGMHHCINVVTRDARHPQAVLIRALQPCVDGPSLAAMAEQRPGAKRVTDLCSGPAKLCAALNIDRALDGCDLVGGDLLWLERARARALATTRIASGPRVGVAYAGDWADRPLRFWVGGNRFVSRG